MRTSLALRDIAELLEIDRQLLTQSVARNWRPYLGDPYQPTRSGHPREYSLLDVVLLAMCIDTAKVPAARMELARRIRDASPPWPGQLVVDAGGAQVLYRPRWDLLNTAARLLRAPPAA